MPDCARCALLAQNRAQKTLPITTRLPATTVAEIEDAARSLGIPRHRVLQAIFHLGTPLALAEVTAQAAAGKE